MAAQPPVSKKKRDISSYFTVYPRQNVPQKRPSPITDEENVSGHFVSPKSPTRVNPRTPQHARARKAEPPSTPRTGKAVLIPIRTPTKPETPRTRNSSIKRFLFSEKTERASPRNIHSSFTFTDIPNSSQALVKNGEVIAIRDSDDDDDTDSLMSLDEIFGKRDIKTETSSSSPPNPDDLEVERVKILSSFTRGRSEAIVGRDKLRALYAQEREQKFDISALLGAHFDDEEIDQNVRKAQQRYDVSRQERDHGKKSEPDRKMLASIAQSSAQDPDDVARFMNAIDRTEVLTGDDAYHFFTNLMDHKPPSEERNCPPEALVDAPFHVWSHNSSAARCRTFLSSAMSDFAGSGLLQDNLLAWVFQQIPLEKREQTRQQYVDCIQRNSRTWTRVNISCSDVQKMFRRLGACTDSARAENSILPQRLRSAWKATTAVVESVIAVLDMFRLICVDMDFAALANLASITCRMSLDSTLMSDRKAVAKVEELLSILLSIPEVESRSFVHDHLLEDLGQNLRDKVLQADLLSHIVPISQHASIFRVKLAQVFQFENPAADYSPERDFSISLSKLTKHVGESSLFSMTRKAGSKPVDYTILKATTRILDIAISDGGRPERFSTRSEEKAFNEAVDELAESIRSVFVAISDSGASHMRRTEAKDVLQALYWRLLYAVRTEVRLKKNVFDAVTGQRGEGNKVREDERSRELMAKFFAKNKVKASTGSGLVPESGLVLPLSASSSNIDSGFSEDRRPTRAQSDLSF